MRSAEVQALLKELADPFIVDSVTLFRSHLATEGASYETIATARLTGGPR